MITEQSRIKAAQDLTFADLDGEAVLLDLKSGQYYGLNEVGTYIWSLIDAPRTVADIVAAMAEEFDVSREQLNLDVMNFLQQMEEQKLIEISHG